MDQPRIYSAAFINLRYTDDTWSMTYVATPIAVAMSVGGFNLIGHNSLYIVLAALYNYAQLWSLYILDSETTSAKSVVEDFNVRSDVP